MTADGPFTAALRANIRAMREARGMSSTQLSDELRAIGVHMEGNIIRKLETGQRQVISVDEWLGFAVVFGVSPIDLTMPTTDTVAITPTRVVDTETVREWARGERPLTPIGDDPAAMLRYVSSMPVARAKRVLRELMER